VRALLALLLSLVLAGCDSSSAGGEGPEIEHPDFRQGQALLQQGDNRRALESFLKVIDDRKDAAESHLEVGRIYLELREPLPAIYHFKQSQRLKPRPERANSIAQLIRSAEKAFMQSIPGQPFDPEGGAVNLDASGRISQLQAENSRLKRELEDLYRQGRGTPPPNPPVASNPAPNFGFGPAPVTPPTSTRGPLPPGARQHTVVSGDTLASLSRRYYGTANRWQEIQRANAAVLNGGTSLRLGMVLVIPQ
jgi:LysM repeat protein